MGDWFDRLRNSYVQGAQAAADNMKPSRRQGPWWGAGWAAALALALLLGAGPVLGAGGQKANYPTFPGGGVGKVNEMSLPEAVFLVVRDNTDIQNAYLDRVTQKFNLEVAEHKFKPDITFDASAARTSMDSSDDYADDTSTWDSNDTQLQADVTVNQMIPTGAQFTFSWQYNRTIGDTSGSYYSDDDATSNTWSIQVQQPLLRGGGIDVNMASVRQARVTEQQNILALKATLINTVTTAITNYRAFLEAAQQVSIVSRSLKRAYELLQENQDLIAAGRMSPSDLVQTQSNLANQRISYQQTLNNVRRTRLELLRTLNMNKNTRLKPTEALKLPQTLPTVEQAMALAYANQPAYLQAKLVLEYSKQDLLLAKNGMLWDLNLLVNYNYTDTNASSYGNTSETDWSAGLYLSVPVYGQPRLGRQAQLLSARSNLLKAQNSLRQAEENLQIDVDNNLQDLRIKWEQVSLAREALKLSREQLSNEQEKLKYGRSSNFQVVTYQLDLANAENTLLSAEVAYLNGLVGLDQILGTTLNTWRIAFKPQRPAAEKKVWER